MLRTFLGEVFNYCIPRRLIRENFAAGVIPKPWPKGMARANRPWSVQELDAVLGCRARAYSRGCGTDGE